MTIRPKGDPLVEQSPHQALLASYQPLPNAEDELIDRTGEMRPQWRDLMRNVGSTPSDELTAIIRRAERLLDENGFPDGKETGPDPKHRPWQLDYLPLVLPEDEWTVLRSGLIQRARLLNAILADIYGPQRLLREGLLPATLIFANPHFLRPCHGTVPADGTFLHYYAADLGRGPDGQWRVLADRTQAPAGFGYALENRIVLSRCAQHLYRHQHIHRLAAFFQTMHNGLLARSKNEEPRIVVLNSGPAKRAYFDHSYVARYLGYTMAEGADLTVRNDRVYLKTVEGLKQVDLILRGIDAGACDPLELSDQSSSGIAGLLQAVRAGTVTIANSLGSGLVETKAFMAYLPRLCRDLLGEDLLLPSNGTWWCGDAEAKRHVMENMGLLTIEPAFERRTILTDEGSIDLGGETSTDQRAAIAERLQTNGKVYVAQENVSLSTTPTTDGGNLAPRPMSVRLFLTFGENSYEAMPGGLTRAWAAEDICTTALRPGDIVKDTWVLSPKPVSGFTLLKTRANAPVVRRRNKDIPSHSADNLFWLGRYTERAEDEMRVLRSVLRRLTEDLADEAERLPIDRALAALVDDNQYTGTPSNERRAVSAQELDSKIRSLMFEANEQRSLQETLHNLHRTATLARDWLSAEAWRALGRLQMDIARYPCAGSKLDVGDALMRVDDGLRLLSAFSGMEMENMTRDFGWRFLDMGRRLERGRHLSRLLRHVLASADTETDGSLTLLLELADSIMTYRWRYLATPMLAPVLDLLLLDETNPRSIGFQIAALAEHVENLPQNPDPPERNAEQRIVIALQASIRLSDFKALGTIDATGTRPALDQLLDDINAALPRLSEAITRTYFSHAEARRPADLMRS